jgi:hypothetical protein
VSDARSDLVLRAVTNNTLWCDSVARAHGRTAHFTVAGWICAEPMPPFYPNLVTIGADIEARRIQHAMIEQLLGASLPDGWGVKDSYACLDLGSFGFHELLDAHWYARTPGALAPPREHIRIARDRDELSTWVDAWGETPRGGAVFPDTLLNDSSVRFLFAPDVRAGLIAAGGGDTIGIGNAFGHHDGVVACIAWLVQAFPAVTIVGWGDRAEVERLQSLGFRALAPMRVWLMGKQQ